jgi:hypothetical protein
MDARSFARSLALMSNVMLCQRPGLSVIEYEHFMQQSFEVYNGTCHMIDGSAAIHPQTLDFLMLCGISTLCQYGHGKERAINAFDTN